MNRYRELIARPLPCLTAWKAWLLRALMLPNVILVRSEGEKHLDCFTDRPCIFVLNHNNTFESLFVPVFIMFHLGGKTVSFVVDWMYGRIPIVGWLLKQIDPVYVYSKRSTLSLLERQRPETKPPDVIERCCEKLASGDSIGIFPEGKRNPHPQMLLRARPGSGHIILRTNVPVLPVGIDYNVNTAFRKIPVLGKMILRFGEPMEFESQRRNFRRMLEDGGSRTEMNLLAKSVTVEVMKRVSSLCGKQYVNGDRGCLDFQLSAQQQTGRHVCP
jgi:1-acyl-sn-glycerol-3-phosphate acyltransferase